MGQRFSRETESRDVRWLLKGLWGLTSSKLMGQASRRETKAGCLCKVLKQNSFFYGKSQILLMRLSTDWARTTVSSIPHRSQSHVHKTFAATFWLVFDPITGHRSLNYYIKFNHYKLQHFEHFHSFFFFFFFFFFVFSGATFSAYGNSQARGFKSEL